MSSFTNRDPFQPWNHPMHRDDPFAPWNSPMRRNDPFEPWNSPAGDKSEMRSREPFFNEVHRSNMSKVWPDGKLHKREDGKTIKPDSYSPADIAGLLHAMQNANRHRPDEEAAGVRQSVMDEVA